jgi:hypothetical protein
MADSMLSKEIGVDDGRPSRPAGRAAGNRQALGSAAAGLMGA